MPSSAHLESVPEEEIARTIHCVRGRRVILDFDLARAYGISTKRLNEQIMRNLSRFPEDFMFRLTSDELAALMRSQIATASQKRRNARFAPFAFTGPGAIMAVRAFVRLRELLASNTDLAKKFADLEARLDGRLIGHDKAIASILAAIRQLMAPTTSPKRSIGFTADIETEK